MTEDQARIREEELATEANQQMASRLILKRNGYFLGTLAAIGLSGVTAYSGQWMLMFCFVVIGLICLSQCWDAQGHLQEVRSRSNRTLYPRFSILRRADPNSTKQAPST